MIKRDLFVGVSNFGVGFRIFKMYRLCIKLFEAQPNLQDRDRTKSTEPNLRVNVPNQLWKVVLVLDNAGAVILGVNENTLAFGVLAPNNRDGVSEIIGADIEVTMNILCQSQKLKE